MRMGIVGLVDPGFMTRIGVHVNDVFNTPSMDYLFLPLLIRLPLSSFNIGCKKER